MNRAFHIGALVWLGTILAAQQLALDPWIGVIFGTLLLAAMIIKGKLPLWAYAAGTAFCACFVSFAVYDALVIVPTQKYEGTTQTLSGVIIDQTDYTTYSELILQIDPQDAPKGLEKVRIRMAVNGGLEVQLGDVVECNISLSCDDSQRNRLYAQNILLEGRAVGAFEKTGEQRENINVRLALYREAINKNIRRQLPGDEGAVLTGMLLGSTERISPEIRYAYARAGISHLLSVSGLHLAILVALAECLLRNLPLSRRQRSLITIVIVVLFMGLAGFSYSIVRAGIMMLLCVSAGLFGRDSDSLNSLGLALILILLINPYAAFSLSLQLSYLATMGIAAFSYPLTDWCCRRFGGKPSYLVERSHKWSFSIVQGASTTVCACLLTAPLICRSFGQISLVSPIVNLLILPFEPIALGCGLLCGFTGLFPQTALLSRALGLPAGIAVKRITETAVWWSELPFASVSVRSDYAILWLTAVIVIGLLLWVMGADRAVKRYAACLAGLCLMVGAFAHAVLWSDTVHVAVANYGSTVTLMYGKQGAIIGAPETVSAARNLNTMLLDYGVERIVLLVTETDDQLYGNPVDLLTDSFPIETAFGLDKTYGFTAELFGNTTLSAQGERAAFVRVETGNIRMVKAFEQIALPADLLINKRNDIICSPDTAPYINDRYFNSRVFALKGS